MGTTTDQVSTDQLRRDIAGQREDIGRDLTAIGDRLSPGRAVDRSRERTRRRVSTWRDRVMGPAQQVKTSIGSGGGSGDPSLSDRATSAAHTATEKAEGSPIAVGLVAFGLGFIAGSALPATRPERQLAQSVEPQVGQIATEMSDAARDVAQQVAPTLRDEFEGARDDVTAAASNVVDTTKDEATSVRDDVTSG